MRIHNPNEIDKNTIQQQLSEGIPVTIQFSEKKYHDKILSEINSLCAANDNKLEIRFYDHEDSPFQGRTLFKINKVKSLSLNSTLNIRELSKLKELECLEILHLGLEKLELKNLLAMPNLMSLQELFLWIDKKNDFNLEYLSEYNNLENLFIYGQPKKIEQIGNIQNLKKLDLYRITSKSLEFVNRLKNLQELVLTLGGRKNINELTGNNIEIITIQQVRGFHDFANLTDFKNLRKLWLMDLPQLQHLHFPTQVSNLLNVAIFNCKNLNSLTGLENLKLLEDITIDRVKIDFEEFMKNSFSSTLKFLAFYTDKVRRDKEICNYLKSLGYYQSRLDAAH